MPMQGGRLRPHRRDPLTGNSAQLRQAIAELEQLLSRTTLPPSRQELLALAGLLQEALARVEATEKQTIRHYTELERRLLAIENSRFMRTLQWPGRVLGDWKGRLGHTLLRSRLHPLYLRLVNPREASDRYRAWVDNERLPSERKLLRQPLLSVVLPVHNPRQEWLEAAIDSVLQQTYGCWQLCICDDSSEEGWVAGYLASRSAAESRIRFVHSPEHLGISGATNLAGEQARGDYTGFLDQDDVLAPHALYCVAEAVQDRQPDLLYSDEDYLDRSGRRVQPIFKPAYSPDLLRCGMYFGHFLVARTAKLQEMGWLRSEYDGSQDYDLALRITAPPVVVRHIPRVLYHWRQHSNSTAMRAEAKPYTQNAGLRALSEVVRRREPLAAVIAGASPNTYRVRWPIPAGIRASLIVCSRNPKWLKRCLDAIASQTSYTEREIVVVQHRTGDVAAMDQFLERSDCLRVPYTGPFNFAAMNNLGASRTTGEVLVFLNDDVEPLEPEWLQAMLAHAGREEVGAVGAKLVYPSGAVQHAGIVIGIMEGAGHLHRNTFGAQYWNWLPATRNVSAVTGACLAIRRPVFEELNGFDESFPVNYNDVDLCLRARQAGYEVIMEPAAVLRHYECQSREAGVRLEERFLFEKRWGALLERGDPYYSPHLTRTREDAGLVLKQPLDAAAYR